MDGIDWMTVAEFVPIAVGLALIGLLGALPMHGIVVALALCGGLIGFAPFNRPVARIFLGDVGSLPIGLLFAWLLVLVGGQRACRRRAAAAALLSRRRDPHPAAPDRRAASRSGRRTARISISARWIAVSACSEAVARVFAINVALVALAFGTVLWPGPWSAAAGARRAAAPWSAGCS